MSETLSYCSKVSWASTYKTKENKLSKQQTTRYSSIIQLLNRFQTSICHPVSTISSETQGWKLRYLARQSSRSAPLRLQIYDYAVYYSFHKPWLPLHPTLSPEIFQWDRFQLLTYFQSFFKATHITHWPPKSQVTLLANNQNGRYICEVCLCQVSKNYLWLLTR